MNYSIEFFKSIVDSITDHIVVIDQKGLIQYVNTAWIGFSNSNGCTVTPADWKSVNYLEICDEAVKTDEKFGKIAADGIRKVIRNELDTFYLEYPCHSNYEKRWFMMRITPLNLHDAKNFVILHQNITERKLAEEEVQKYSYIDGLTDLANRRHFDEFFNQEWRRCERLKQPLSLILLDVDRFKLFNDYYGHVAGDDCLRKIGIVLKSFGNRPSDLSARYGGEEFALILGNTAIKESTHIAEAVLYKIRDLAIPHAPSSPCPVVTASVGIAMMYPRKGTDETALTEAADKSLYRAKHQGRNRVFADAL